MLEKTNKFVCIHVYVDKIQIGFGIITDFAIHPVLFKTENQEAAIYNSKSGVIIKSIKAI
jgi:hypothetical protein